MNVYDQFVDPSTVTHSTTAYLTSSTKKDLIVVKNTVLQIFNVINNKLVLLHELKLNGQVSGISNVKLSNSPLEQLVVLTKFAKLSLISWDADKSSISTNSLHFYETEFETKNVNTIDYHHESQLRIDPNGFASLVFYNDTLAFLPFKQENDLDNEVNQSNEYFESSIIVPVSKLEASITSIIDCGFLYNYRDPTLAILYNNNFTWAADLAQRKDTVNFTVLSLDLSTGSSTPILNVENLPYDIWLIKPLPSPLSGSLLIGSNEIIHIDNSGNTIGIGVNKFYKESTDFELNDQSDLDLFLEDSKIEIISRSKVLIIDKKGGFYVLNFILDGKSIKKISIKKIVEPQILSYSPSTIAIVEKDLIFVGSASSDALLLKINEINKKPIKETTKKKAFEDEDDIYGDDEEDNGTHNDLNEFELQEIDMLINHGPISSFTLGKLSPEPLIQGLENPNKDDTSIVATTGEGSFGGLTCFSPSIKPKIHSTLRFNNINKSWNVLDKYLVTTDLSNFKSEIFLLNDNFKIFQTFDFKNNNITINIDTVFRQKRILQVASTNIYLFDTNFKKLFQIKADFEILNAKIYDPFVIITNSKGEIKIFEIDSNGKKLNKVKLPESLNEIILTSGTISSTNILNRSTKRKLDDTNIDTFNPIFIVTTVNNQILAFEKNHEDKVYQFKSINKLTEISELQLFDNPEGLIPDPFIKEVELVKLGDNVAKEEYLVILTIGGELILYKTFRDTENNYRFLKDENINLITGAPENIYAESTILERKLTTMEMNGHSFVFVTGKQPYIIYKSSKSSPKIFKFTSKSAISICKFKLSNSSTIEDKFMYIDNLKTARICSIPFSDSQSFNLTGNLPIERFRVGSTVNNVVYHETSKLFVLSTLDEFPYNAIDEEGTPIVGVEEDKPSALNYKSTIKLINPKNWFIIDQIELPDNHVVNDIKSMRLTVSSRSKKKKEYIVLGVGEYRLEDLTVYGNFQLQDIISIVPDPNKPELNFKFKEISKETIKGAVTTTSEISGRFLVSQGSKILIRDLQQDNSTVPVAFYDTPTYLSESKSFGNLLLVGDTLKSILFLGFDAEPYRLLLLGKDLQNVNISSADFIVDNGEVYFLVADDNEQLQILSYQPDDPKSLSGQKLLKKTNFQTNSLTTTLRMLPKYEEFSPEEASNSFQNIGANVDGSLFKVTPISESSYRRLYILQQQLSDKVAHYCGLNPRANRYQNNEVGYKPIIEFGLIRWFIAFNVDKRNQFSAKVGKNTYLEIWRDLVEIENSLKNLSLAV